jgi:hypothetical protein
MTIANKSTFTDTDVRKIFFIHSFNDEKRYIVGFLIPGSVTYQMYWTTDGQTLNDLEDTESSIIHISEDAKITSVGKWLIISDNQKTDYLLWLNGEYSDFGNIPEPRMEFRLRGGLTFSQSQDNVSCVEVEEEPSALGGYEYLKVADGKQGDYNNLVIGLYSKSKNEAAKNKYFVQPFAVRFALELYDGSYTMISPPIMLFPAITRNCYSHYVNDTIQMFIYSFTLEFKADFDYSEWSDIVKDVVVFASDGVELYDTTGDQRPSTAYGNLVWDGVYSRTHDPNVQKYGSETPVYNPNNNFIASIPMNTRDNAEILEDLASTSLYYKLFSAGIKGSGTFESSRNYIKRSVLENITTQDALNADDYFSHCPVSGTSVMSYNRRLILSDVSRGFYAGADTLLPYHDDSSHTYSIYVHIKTASGNRVVKKEISTYEKMGIYYFYPDPRAYKAEVFMNGSLVASMDLKEHPFLHGAYYFGHLPDGTEGETAPISGNSQQEPTANMPPEHLPNEIYVSEVNNPFVFPAEGSLNVGSGRILGISSLTQALSEGQFGQYPLIVFTTEGIWAASVGKTGLLTDAHPMSREVCNNAKSITQTDGAVFFSSEKGLMVIVGSQVKCVSEQMNGRDGSSMGSFKDFLRSCFIAYDYRDSLLWIFSRSNAVCYVYSIANATFARYAFATPVTSVVNDYPDYLLQQNKAVLSLMTRPDINADAKKDYAATLITRPLKLENALALKSIMQIRHICTPGAATLTLRISASNNLTSWVDLHSLRGTPWKYYRLQYDFRNLSATDRFAGTVLVTQERRSLKLR